MNPEQISVNELQRTVYFRNYLDNEQRLASFLKRNEVKLNERSFQ